MAAFSQPAGTELGQTVGNTLEVVVAAILFYRLAEGRTQFGRVRDVAALVAATAAGTAISAVFRAAPLQLGDVIPSAQVGAVWRTWFLGDLSGALVFAPWLLCRVNIRIDSISARQAFEGAAIAPLIVVLALLPSQRDVPYIVFPVLIWSFAAGLAEQRARWHWAPRLPSTTQHTRRTLRTGHDHPARHAVVRSSGGSDLAGARRGHRGAPRRSRRAARKRAATTRLSRPYRQSRRRSPRPARAQPHDGGLRGLADRAEALGGKLELQSPPGHGRLLTASITCER